MPLDDQERMVVARTQLAQQAVCRLVVEVAKRRPARAGQRRSLSDAVMNQRIVHDQIVAAEQMSDDGDVCRMTTDEHGAILAAMKLRQRLLQLALQRPLAGNPP